MFAAEDFTLKFMNILIIYEYFNIWWYKYE